MAAGAKEDILYDAKPPWGYGHSADGGPEPAPSYRRSGRGGPFRAQVTGLTERWRLDRPVAVGRKQNSCDRAYSGHRPQRKGHRDHAPMNWAFPWSRNPSPWCPHRAEPESDQQGPLRRPGPKLPAADYKLVGPFAGDRTVYTFCTCPGGYVVAALPRPGGRASRLSYPAGGECQRRIAGKPEPGGFPFGTDPLSGCAGSGN